MISIMQHPIMRVCLYWVQSNRISNLIERRDNNASAD